MYKVELDEYGYLVISEGTLNPDHLIPVFLSFLSDFTETHEEEQEIAGYYKDYEEMTKKADYEGIAEFCDFLYDELQDIAPENAYFGGMDGDPACIGFWMVDENEF